MGRWRSLSICRVNPEVVLKNSDYKNLSRYVSSYLGSLKSHSVEINDQEWNYLDGGQGETILFLHGLAGSKVLWRSLMQSYINDYRVIAVDIPGLFVEQRFIGRKHTYRELANWLELFLEHLQIDKLHIVGHSSGSCVSSCFASTRPSMVESVTLLNHHDVLSDDAVGHPSTVLNTVLDATNEEGWEDFQKKLFYSPPAMPKFVQRYRLRSMLKHKEGFVQVVQDLAELRPMAMSYLRKIKCPVLTVNGSHDIFSPLEFHRSLKSQIPWGEHVLIERCGHASFLEKPDDILAIHKSFLDSVKEGAESLEYGAGI
ncbi:hypothetical protein A9Q99_11000 [Gammaproteobacteria bacterium 45_16_T64]|nr:hypothetical protein A9Q99_11000 [Gammaproteobacteria bacterium 45_16_T64]